MKNYHFYFFILIFLVSCNVDYDPDPELTYFTKLLEGKFSSKKQSEQEEGYMHVCLINSVIWKNRADGHWFYHELYSAEKATTVYNQRIINVHRIDSSTIVSTSYSLLEKEKFQNGWKNLSLFDTLTKDDLQVRDGCDLLFKKKTSTIYLGKTKTGTCLSSFRKDMTYTTSNVVLSSDKITSWDRGFDKEGRQVWGKIQGPYKYERIK